MPIALACNTSKVFSTPPPGTDTYFLGTFPSPAAELVAYNAAVAAASLDQFIEGDVMGMFTCPVNCPDQDVTIVSVSPVNNCYFNLWASIKASIKAFAWSPVYEGTIIYSWVAKGMCRNLHAVPTDPRVSPLDEFFNIPEKGEEDK